MDTLRVVLAATTVLLLVSRTAQGNCPTCCYFTVQNCSMGVCYCDQLCYWYDDCCKNDTNPCPSASNTTVITANGTKTEAANSVVVMMAEQNKVLRRIMTFSAIVTHVVNISCSAHECTTYGTDGSVGSVALTTGYDVIITSVSRNSSNISGVEFYVTANNGSLVIAAEDVVSAMKEDNGSALLQAEFTVYDIRATSPSEENPNTTSEVSASTSLQPTMSFSLDPSTMQSSFSATELPFPSTSPSPSPSSPSPPSSSSSSHFRLDSSLVLSPSPYSSGSPTAAPAANELKSQVIGLIVGGVVGGALISMVLLVLVIARCVRNMRAKQDPYREISFTEYTGSEDDSDIGVKPKKKGRIVVEYEKLD